MLTTGKQHFSSTRSVFAATALCVLGSELAVKTELWARCAPEQQTAWSDEEKPKLETIRTLRNLPDNEPPKPPRR